ncbi:HAD-IC family P-type ATPase [Candidatus Hodarchaeum mangrovi]
MINAEEVKEKGLNASEVLQRQNKYGKNKLPEKKSQSAALLYLSQYKNPLIYIILVAAVISFLLEQYEDTIIIGIVILLDTIIGFFQEYRAEKTVIALRSLLKPTARVIRDGSYQQIDISEIVPDDIVLLHPGDKIPADGEIFEAVSLSLNEAILTGESEAILKNETKDKFVFMGTTVLSGRALMKVTKTGPLTELGKIAVSLADIEERKTPLQMKLEVFGKTLTYIVIAISFSIFIIGVLFDYNILEMVRMAVVLAIAAIPEGLIIAVTMILAIGMRKILQRKGLVKKLLAVETLGSVTTICTDKTGTLTEGNMQVVKTDFIDENMAFHIMALCNNQEDSLEVQLWQYVKNSAPNFNSIVQNSKRISEVPFSSELKYMITTNLIDGTKVNLLKGAPDIILESCNLEPDAKNALFNQIDSWASSGLKLLGLAYKKGEESDSLTDYTWVGLLGIEDPIRKSVIEAIALCRRAGINVKIITGDYRKTALNIAFRLGLNVSPKQTLEGFQIDELSDKQLEEIVDEIVIFCRVSPSHKLRVISALQNCGEITAMIGDGVNDAPALKKANIGVSVGGATDVAQETASLILLDKNFKTLVDAVEEGRTVFDNIRKVVAFVLSNSFAEILTIFGSFVLGWPTPLNIAQILWIHLICDGPSDIALGFEKAEKGIMDEPPRAIQENILDMKARTLIFSISTLSALLCLLIFGYSYLILGDIKLGSTIVFVILGIQSLAYIFSFRSLRTSLFYSGNFFENKILIFSVILGVSQILLGLYIPFLSDLLEVVPLNINGWIVIISVSTIMITMVELIKYFDRKRHNVSAYENIFSKIHEIREGLPKIHNLHNLSIDIMKDKTLIQFHFNVPAETSLQIAHEVSKSLEKKIANEFPNALRKNLEIISHIEPAHISQERIHTHPEPSTSLDIKEQIESAVNEIAQIKSWGRDIVLHDEGFISLALTIYVDGSMSIGNAHQLNDELEFLLRSKIPSLKRCIIHSEPYSVSNS